MTDAHTWAFVALLAFVFFVGVVCGMIADIWLSNLDRKNQW